MGQRKKKISRENLKIFQLTENKNKTYQNLWDQGCSESSAEREIYCIDYILETRQTLKSII
jgi:hypothetical protein